jgi:hypothetical protein
MPPPPDECEIAGVRYASHLLAVVEEDGRAAIHRRRDIEGPGDRHQSVEDIVRLDRVTAAEVEAEAAELGFLPERARSVPQTEEYLGSTVVVLRAP